MYILSAVSSYFTSKTIHPQPQQPPPQQPQPQQPQLSPKIKKLKKSKYQILNPKLEQVYLVLNKNTQTPLGIYSTKELALKYGKESTYCNCTVYKYIVDNKCNFYMDPIYEDN